MKLIKKVHRMDMLPAWYGMAWQDFASDSCTCLPVGLNLIAAAARGVWFFIKHGGRYIPMDPRAAYDQGRADERAANRSLRNIDFDAAPVVADHSLGELLRTVPFGELKAAYNRMAFSVTPFSYGIFNIGDQKVCATRAQILSELEYRGCKP